MGQMGKSQPKTGPWNSPWSSRRAVKGTMVREMARGRGPSSITSQGPHMARRYVVPLMGLEGGHEVAQAVPSVKASSRPVWRVVVPMTGREGKCQMCPSTF
uniref:Uncharacterized protein n=1 Tax=Solanum tuberosum TaxID=4113 RepID=M1DM27_SOLTU